MNQRLHRRLAVSLALVLGVWTTPVFGVEEKEVESAEWAALTLKMESEGWQQVDGKVFERRLGEGKVEHLGYGAEGLAWTVSELNRHLERLLAEFELHPTIELAETIEGLSGAIARTYQELRSRSRAEASGLTAAPWALEGPSCDGVCYSATADAYHQTSQQGVGATAMAKLTNPCGYSGTTYAYAYARGTVGTTMTEVTQQDPKSGVNITSNAVASAAGGSGALSCLSIAAAVVESSLLGFSYSTSDTNDGYCPVPPNPVPAISGTSYEFFSNLTCRSRTWTSSVTGGVAPFSYQWKVNGTVVGTGSSYTRSICPASGSFTLSLTVTGANGGSGTVSRTVVVDYEPPIDPCGGTTRLACP